MTAAGLAVDILSAGSRQRERRRTNQCRSCSNAVVVLRSDGSAVAVGIVVAATATVETLAVMLPKTPHSGESPSRRLVGRSGSVRGVFADRYAGCLLVDDGVFGGERGGQRM